MEEALCLVDEEGAGALSMRKLARRLDVEAMTLYAHVANKQDLLDAVGDRVASELALPEVPREDWQGRIRAVVVAWAGMQKAHPGGFPLLYRRRQGTDRERAVNEEIMDALATAGFDDAGVALGYQTLVSFLDGALLSRPRRAHPTFEGWTWVAAHVDAERYPHMAAAAPHAARLSWDDVFYSGLDLFLRGLERTLARQAP